MRPVVLILESSPELRRTLEEGLRQGGYAVKTASDTEEAIAVMRRAPIDAVLADPPGSEAQDGAQMLDRIQEEFPDVPAILVAPGTSDLEELLSDPSARPQRRLLRCPFTLGELLNMVARVTGQRRADTLGA